MCAPAAVLLPIISTAMTAATTVHSVDQQNEAGKRADKVAQFNARQSENEATRTRNVGVEAENAHREKTAQLVESQRAQFGAQGVDINTGSALDVQTDTKLLGEVDSLRIRRNYSDQAAAIDQGAAFTRNQGKNARVAGRNQAAGTLLAGAGSIAAGVANQWYSPDSAALG